ncbi:hypothetical protein BJV78DRAFT_1237551 [Lactifluus subvellereus]|nr:hypothetical protein BJV78DRAFT_1237551 [Lactifluus subvellereus]
MMYIHIVLVGAMLQAACRVPGSSLAVYRVLLHSDSATTISKSLFLIPCLVRTVRYGTRHLNWVDNYRNSGKLSGPIPSLHLRYVIHSLSTNGHSCLGCDTQVMFLLHVRDVQV